jgi:salicylate biosynthesis isochorismate synthase
MEGITTGHMQLVGVSVPVPAGRRLAGPWTLAWTDGGRSFLGRGIAAELVASAPSALFDAVSAARIDVDDESIAPPSPWFGGFAFDSAAPVDGWWEGFPAGRAILPELLLSTDGDQARLTAFARVEEAGVAAARDRARRLLADGRAQLIPEPEQPLPAPTSRLQPEDRPGWESLVSEALSAFGRQQLRKVVLARALDVVAPRPFDAWAVLKRVENTAGPAVSYGFAGGDGTMLVGASPERLFVLEGGFLETQALASSAPPEQIDRLTGGPKEAREHAAVVESIRSALGPLSMEVEVGRSPEPLALGYVAHLRTPVRARLRPGVRAAEVVRALHPTAAVGGTPREEALAFLRRHEGLARGWYAGAVGWLGADAADLRVALRCALLRGSTARLFSGAGVVPGSTAEDEWHETAVKARFMLRALGTER